VNVMAMRYARFCQSLRNEILAVTHACGYEHPAQFTTDDIELSSGPASFKPLREIYGYVPSPSFKGIEGWGTQAKAKKPALESPILTPV
jgi:hypothetical protein